MTSTAAVLKVVTARGLGSHSKSIDPHTITFISEDSKHGVTYVHAYTVKKKYAGLFAESLKSIGCAEDQDLPTTDEHPSSFSKRRRKSKVEFHTETQESRRVLSVFAGQQLGSVVVKQKVGDDVIRSSLAQFNKGKTKGPEVAIVISADILR